MSGYEDLRFDRESTQKITQGLTAAIVELRDVGSATGSVMGKGLSDLSLTGMEAGHHGLSTDFEDFCERWEWGVRALVQDANTLAAALGLAAGRVWEEDQYRQGTLKVALNSVVGNPHASEEEVTRQSWGEVFTPDYLNPDYSGESFERAREEAAQTWKDTGRALVTEGAGGQRSRILNEALGVDQGAFDRAVDETFGPSPQERAAREGGGG
ncbi:hypothetical protein ACFVIM_09310 [Streptomyces sp. NPDC057638]|uniref:hypothetical protein n=1 Tax=Streptomyces sp. NPDC057638 TaxID=3346190 RepID=UPI0036A2FBB2